MSHEQDAAARSEPAAERDPLARLRSQQIDFSRPIPGTYLTTGRVAMRGFRLSKFCMTFREPENREAFKRDEEAYMALHHLTEHEKDIIRRRDWLEMVKYGVNVFMVLKVSFATGYGLAATGASMRGETREEFMKTRNVPEAS